MRPAAELLRCSSQCCVGHPHYVEVSLFTTTNRFCEGGTSGQLIIIIISLLNLPFVPWGMNVAFYAYVKHSSQTGGLLRNCRLTWWMDFLVFLQNHKGCVLCVCVSAERFVTLSATLTWPLRWRIPPLITCFGNSYKGLKWCPRSSRRSANYVNSRAKLLVVPVL